MTLMSPATRLDKRFSSPGASPRAWDEARRHLQEAGVYQLSTVRPDGRPHVAPLIGLWLDEAFYFCTGPDEQKAKNLEANEHVAVTVGGSSLQDGLDIIVEGDAVPVTDAQRLQRIADAYVAKYGEDWRFEVRDRGFHSRDGGDALVFRVSPVKALGFGRSGTASGPPTDDNAYSQTRWRF